MWHKVVPLSIWFPIRKDCQCGTDLDGGICEDIWVYPLYYKGCMGIVVLLVLCHMAQSCATFISVSFYIYDSNANMKDST